VLKARVTCGEQHLAQALQCFAQSTVQRCSRSFTGRWDKQPHDFTIEARVVVREARASCGFAIHSSRGNAARL
jgi:hypothetical protein